MSCRRLFPRFTSLDSFRMPADRTPIRLGRETLNWFTHDTPLKQDEHYATDWRALSCGLSGLSGAGTDQG
jgi:hypothetical protein